jgi:hypothetical protein
MKLSALCCIGALVVGVNAANASESDNITVVSARTSSDYVRPSAPGGGHVQEPYAFAQGGKWDSAVSDSSMDSMSFMDVARTLSVPLAEVDYVPTRDPRETKLLIVVYWGRTNTGGAVDNKSELQSLQDASAAAASSKSANQQQKISATKIQGDGDAGNMVCGHIETNTTPQQVTDQIEADNAATAAMAIVSAENAANDKAYAQNAAMLGYDAFLNETGTMAGTALQLRRQDAIDELQRDRYFVVLMAYDFQKMWKEKKHKLLWETRLSIDQRGNRFDQQLAMMARSASVYFGRDSHGLAREGMPTGRVEVGDVKSLGIVSNR